MTYGDGGQLPEFEVSSSYPCMIIGPAPGRTVGSSSSVSCDEPHEAEMFAGFGLYSSSTVVEYPGVPQLSEFGAGTCRFYFDSGLVVGADKGRLQVVALVPAETAFEHNSSTVAGSPSSASAPCTACCGRPTAASCRAAVLPSNRAERRGLMGGEWLWGWRVCRFLGSAPGTWRTDQFLGYALLINDGMLVDPSPANR